jgi:hypothetical protein
VVEAVISFDCELFQTPEGRHQVYKGVVFEGGMMNPRMHEFLRVIPQPRKRQQGDAMMSAIIRNEDMQVVLSVGKNVDPVDLEPIPSNTIVVAPLHKSNY